MGLICTVRGCGLPLVRAESRFVCERLHSFDVARSGYINLLQPQDRKSKQPGDTLEAVAARRRLHDHGVTQPLFRAIAEMVEVSSDDSVLDAGCGEGFYLGSLTAGSRCGVDISIPAVDLAARRYPGCEWVVANADRMVPYSDGSFSVVMSITARMNSPEFRRVVREDGRLLIALAASDDLVELRGGGRDRAERTIDAFRKEFALIGEQRVTTVADLDADGVNEVLHSIYRPRRFEAATAMRVTFSLDLLLFRVH